VGSRVKSEVISHVRFGEETQSDKGIIRRLILHSDFDGSQVYSESVLFSFSRRKVYCCHSSDNEYTGTATGKSPGGTMGKFLRSISRVDTTAPSVFCTV